MLRKLFIVSILMSCCLYNKAQTNDSVFSAATLTSITLLNADNNQSQHVLKTAPEKRSLFIFLSPECPLCKNYSTMLNSLHQQFKNTIVFYGIIPGKTYSAKDVEAFKSTYQILFPLLIDSEKQLSNYLLATTTPQVILLDEHANLVYKGAIDNLAVSLGKQRLKPSQLYLQNAITASLQHQAIAVKRTKAIGCKINDY